MEGTLGMREDDLTILGAGETQSMVKIKEFCKKKNTSYFMSSLGHKLNLMENGEQFHFSLQILSHSIFERFLKEIKF